MENQWELKSDSGSNDWRLERITWNNFESWFVEYKNWLVRQPTTTTTVMNMNPLVAFVPVNVLCIQLPTYHGNDYPII
jgi:hypothetical protein